MEMLVELTVQQNNASERLVFSLLHLYAIRIYTPLRNYNTQW